ncbi:hypothetical protein BCR34DRAFT_571074 [Clohesyomyces aquaticus]|uniref:Aspartic peptidase domain-containing protein n=1 Tax=Clohesyomyces aquaticus TaxID=1231657 RepID=A0A1Y1Z910_9PLEO|nr:hypothetical protein BCR34DRAFT_571074 [Clohesyomyces aquaticus]
MDTKQTPHAPVHFPHSRRHSDHHPRDPIPTSRVHVRRARLAAFAFLVVLCILLNSLTRTTQTRMAQATQTQTPRPTGPLSISIPWTPPFASTSVPQIHASISGHHFELPVDTGSTGLLIGAPLLPSIAPPEGTPSFQYFSSSNNFYSGRLVNLAVTFHGAHGSTATANVPVLVVDKSVKCPWYDPERDGAACPPNPDPHGPEPELRDTGKIMYMGVGFGRNVLGDKRVNGAPSGNPFLNIESINNQPIHATKDPRTCKFRIGYTLSTLGVDLGLTDSNTQGFKWVDLDPGTTHSSDMRDWAMVDMCFSFSFLDIHDQDQDQSVNCGKALIDTGIEHMYIRTGTNLSIPSITIPNPNPDGYAKEVQRVKPGTKIAVGFPTLVGDRENSVAVHEFVVGDGEKRVEAPSYVVPEKPRVGVAPYVNTGRNFLWRYEVAFDAVEGRFGFRETNKKTTLSQSLGSSLSNAPNHEHHSPSSHPNL